MEGMGGEAHTRRGSRVGLLYEANMLQIETLFKISFDSFGCFLAQRILLTYS